MKCHCTLDLLHPEVACSWTQTYTAQDALLFLGNQGKIITNIYNQLCLVVDTQKTESVAPTIHLVQSLPQVPLQLLECQRTD